MDCTANVELPCDRVGSVGWTVQLMLRCLVTYCFCWVDCTANVEMPCDCVVSAGWNVQLMLRCLVTVLFLLGGMYS